MKKLCVAVVLFAVGIVFVAVWFSPLVWIGEPTAYYDNMPVASLDGLCASIFRAGRRKCTPRFRI